MNSKKMMFAVIAVAAVAMMLLPSISSDSDARTMEAEGYDYQMFDVFMADLIAPGKVVSPMYDYHCYFIAGSDNEKAFIEYYTNGGTMPGDDKATIATGNSIHVYLPSTSRYMSSCSEELNFNGKNISVTFDRVLERQLEMGFYIEEGEKYSITVAWSNTSVGFSFDGYSLKSGVTSTGSQPYNGMVYLEGNSSIHFQYMWVTIDYTIDGVKDPLGVGSGGDIVAIILLVIGCGVIGYMVYLLKGPKWAR